jgi:hypothetical protein
MDQKERQILVSIISSILIIGAYVLYVYKRQVVGNFEVLDDFSFWGKTFLKLIPVAIMAQIVIHIIYAIINRIITNEDIPTKDDERDKYIELKSIRISHWIFVLGFVAAMVFLALGSKPSLMFIIIFVSGFISTIISEIAKFIYYRRGF